MYASHIVRITAALLLGAAGYYCKNRAEAAYDDYLTTGHPGKMKDHFNRARRLDQWSGALYIAGEGVLGITVYFSMKELWK